ncbi:DUF4347 domain-containing protein, partial [Aquabacterium sp.]|uniref:DUF4347 domain-containing protein n=1 Tax=Aquabacterium sp. TaxID=1872578 RepID=UPI003D6D2D67
MTRKPVSGAVLPPRKFDGQLEELESRILYSADLQAIVPDLGVATRQDEPVAQVAVLPAPSAKVDQALGNTQGVNAAETSSVRLELVFVDASVPDAEQLVALLQGQNDAGRTLEIHWLDAQSDGVSQITEVLKGRQGIDALHLIGHGDGEGMQLGNDRLDGAGLNLHMGDLASWGGALSADADLLLYGCDLASSSAGRALVDNLALLTGADVAASTDATGSALLGGDWTLEYQDGRIETSVAMAAPGQASWQHLLSITASTTAETLVNGTTTGTQENNADSGKQVAADANGNYVVVWEDATTTHVYGRMYNADGTPKASEFRINTNTATTKDQPTVAMDANGNFVVAWRSVTQDGAGYGIYAQRYNASGVAQGSEFRVNTTTASDQSSPAIAMNTLGFVITWTSLGQDGSAEGVYAQRYNASGVAQGSEFRVNTTTANIQKDSQIGMDSSGNFVIAWSSYAQDGSGYGVYAQRYNASGVAQGAEFRVNVSTTGEQILSDVSMNASGNFVIAWHDSSAVDGSGYGVFARTYNSSGVAQTSEFVLSNYTYSTQWNASVVMGDDGSFVAAWESLTADGYSYGIAIRQFSLAGVEIAPETIVNTTRSGDQQMPSVAWGGQQVIVTWSGNGSGDNLGIFSRRYTTALPAVVTSVGTETRANTTTSNTQQTNSNAGKQVATAANGNYVVVWEDTITDFVYGRLYDANGTALTAEFRVNTDTTAARNKDQPTVAMDDNGNFVIAWHSQLQDGAGYGIYAQRYNASGVAQGSEFRVNTYTTSDQEYPAIAMSAVGFVITWTSNGQDGSVEGIYAQRYNASGVAQGSEFRVNTTTSNIQTGSKIGMDDNGNFVIAWSSYAQDGAGYGVYAQRYNASGVAQGSEFRVNVNTAGEQILTDVSMNGSGSFVISWDASAADAAGYGTFARTYNSSGTALSGEIQLNSFELDEQRNSSVSMSDNGDFVAVFQSGLQDGLANAIALRVFSQTGAEIGGERLVNTTQSGSQSIPSVSWNGGYIAVVWSGNGTGDNLGVFSQRYVSNAAPVITSNGGGSSASVNVAENSTAVTTVVATDAVDQTLVYSISGGADAALFAINSSTGVLSFIGAPNFEAPGDSGANNVYDVVVMVSDGYLTDTQSLAITVTDLNDNPPVITSNGGGSSASINVAENSTAVATVVATDADAGSTFTYSISGGSDSAKFSINASTGVLTFLVAPNHENPTDTGANNVYDVIVRVSDGVNADTQALAITVTDVDEFDVGAVSDTNAAANSVAENATNGTVVGITANATDADGTTNTITYSLSDNAGGRFAINASTGVVTVANGSLLNYEAATSHAITVVATSADGSSSNQAMTINLADVDEFDVGAVSDANAAANSVAENAT